MTTLDQPNTFDESSVSPWPVIQRWALIGGLAFIIFFMITVFTGLNKPGAGILAGVISFVVSAGLYFGIAALAIRQHRDEDLGSFITFKRGFRVGFLSLFLAALISTAFTLLYVTVIDPSYYDTMLEALTAEWQGQGMTDEQIEQTMAFTKPMMNPVATLIVAAVMGAIFSAIMGLIAASVFKRVPPQS